MAEGDTLLNALIGGVVSIVLSFVPFSPVLGGAVAGYLQGGERGEGARVGAYAGVVAAIPIALFLFVAVALFGFIAVSPGGGGGGGAGVFLVVVLVVIVLSALYTVAFSALGGWLGNYVKYETDLFE
jgi:hypothetical protein